MTFFESIRLAFLSLKTNPLRSVLTLIGIAVGIGAVLYVVVLGEITQQSINERLESLGSNVLQIRPGYSHMRGVRTDASVVNLKLSDARELAEVSEVITVTVPTYSGQGMIEYRDKNWSSRVTGTTTLHEAVNNDYPIEGRFFSAEEYETRARVCILGATVHEKLFDLRSPIGEPILINSSRFTVVGLLGVKGEGWSSPDDQVLIPLTTAQERLFGVDHLSGILAQVRSPSDYDEALFDIETTLRRNHRLQEDKENDFQVRRQDVFLSTIQETNQEISDFIVLIALVSLVVGGIGIANVMLVSVAERIREIGIRRAVGAQKSHIMVQFLIEAATLGVFGGILGIVGGTLFNIAYIGENVVPPATWVFNSFLICASIGCVAGLYPAFRAANEDVIEALRYE